MAKFEYSYPIEELNALIEKMNKGIKPAVPEEMLLEAKMYYQELQNELFDGEDDILTEEDIKRHNELVQKRVDEEKHKAHREDIKVVKIGEKQRAKLHKAVCKSIVRPTFSDYNKTDEELYGDEERKNLYQRLDKVKSIVRNQYDYRSAIMVIRDVIQYSLDHDYPGIPKDEVYAAYKRGEIKINIPIPKLFSDYVHEVTDKETLKAIANGDLELVSRSQLDEEMVKKDYSNSELVYVPYDTITGQDYVSMAEMHRKGIDTPISPVLNNRSKIYNQFTLPSDNMFSKVFNTNTAKNELYKNGYPEPFDWEQDHAAMLFMEKVRGIDPYDPNQIANILNTNNDNSLSQEFRNLIRSGNNIRIASGDGSGMVDDKTYQEAYSIQKPKDPKTLQLEQNILRAIQDSN